MTLLVRCSKRLPTHITSFLLGKMLILPSLISFMIYDFDCNLKLTPQRPTVVSLRLVDHGYGRRLFSLLVQDEKLEPGSATLGLSPFWDVEEMAEKIENQQSKRGEEQEGEKQDKIRIY